MQCCCDIATATSA